MMERDKYRQTNRLISERLSNGKVSVDGDPHERVHRDRPEGHLDVAGQPTRQVTEHPPTRYGGVYGQGYNKHSTQ